MPIVFQKSGLSDLTLERGRLVPYSRGNISVNQERYLTESNNAKITDYGNNITFIELAFDHLTKDNYDGSTNGLKTWFESTQVNWSANSFTMLDEENVSHTVRFWQGSFDMPTKANGRFSFKLVLKDET